MRLPKDACAIDDAAFTWYGGSPAMLLHKFPAALDVSPALSSVNHVPEDKLLKQSMDGELLHQIWRAILPPHGALDDISTTLPRSKYTTFLEPALPKNAASPWWALSYTYTC